MSGTDITKLESLLRDCRLEAEIDPSHKERLRHQLLAVEDVRPAPVFRFAFAGGAVFRLITGNAWQELGREILSYWLVPVIMCSLLLFWFTFLSSFLLSFLSVNLQCLVESGH